MATNRAARVMLVRLGLWRLLNGNSGLSSTYQGKNLPAALPHYRDGHGPRRAYPPGWGCSGRYLSRKFW